MILSDISLSRRTLGLVLAQLGLVHAVAAQSVTWEPVLDAALARARQEGRIVMVAMNMAGERESDRVLQDHYQDPIIASLMQQTVNVFCSDGNHKKSGTCPRCKQNDCASHRNNGFNVRRKFFEQEGHDPVRQPRHVFLTPAGKVFSSAVGRLAVGELEWMIREAMRLSVQYKDLVDAGTERSHAPTSYRRGSVDTSAKARKPIPTKKQLTEAIEQAKSSGGRGGRGGRRGRRGSSTPDWVEVLVRVEDRKARSVVDGYLKSSRDARARTLSLIGRESPVSWQKLVTEWLSSDSEGTRRAAIVALNRIAEPKTVTALKKFHRREKNEELEGRFLRALAAAGPTNSSVISAVVKAATRHETDLVRAHAMVAAGALELRKPVVTCLQAGLQDSSLVVRAVTAYVIAERQFHELDGVLAKSLQAESEDEIKGWMQKSVAALASRDPKEFDEFLRLTIDKPAEGRRGGERNRGEEGDGRGGGEAGAGSGRRGGGDTGGGRRRKGG